MSNIFNSFSKYFGPKEHTIKREYYPAPREDSGKGLIVIGYSVVYFDSKPNSRVNNFDNL
jgi:hypothetical protein